MDLRRLSSDAFRITPFRIARLGLAAGAISLLVLAPASLAEEAVGRVTASAGQVEGIASGALDEGDHVRVGQDGGCSVLVDRDAVVELCGQTNLVITKDPKSNTRIVSIEKGSMRIVVEPRDTGERIEIHTPAAIATLLGTIVHVSIDPETGVTTIASAESQVAVRSTDPKVKGRTVVDALQQVVVTPGEAPPENPTPVDKRRIDEMGGCLIDFHHVALGEDLSEHETRVAERLTAIDVARNAEGGRFDGPDAGSRPFDPPVPGDSIDGQADTCQVTDCGGDVPSDPNMRQGGSFQYPFN